MFSQLSSQLVVCLYDCVFLPPTLHLPPSRRNPLIRFDDLRVSLGIICLVLSLQMRSIFYTLLIFILCCLKYVAFHHKSRTILAIMRKVCTAHKFDRLCLTAEGPIEMDGGLSFS